MKPSNLSQTRHLFDFNRISIVLSIGLLVSFIVAYFPVWKGLLAAWIGTEEYSHGFLIIPLSVYIVWTKKDDLSEISVMPSGWGLMIVILSLLIYLFAHLAEIVTLASLSMVMFLVGVCIYIFGFAVFRKMMFPFFLLLFMIPVPAQIYAALTIPLQLLVSKVSVILAQVMDIPVYREGNVINLPERTLQVVQACSGLRSMISLLTLSAVIGYFTLKSNFLRSILFLSGIPAAIIVNMVRVFIVIVAFYFFNYDLTTGSVHTVFGIVIFFLALFFIILAKGVLVHWDS